MIPTLVFTGQDPMLDARAFGLADFPGIDLGCPGREDPHAHVRAVMTAMLPLLRRRPDLLVVQGDTSSALGAALAAFTSGVPVAHVEAGLRTYDSRLPWPEEEYRTAIDADADLLFAPTEFAASNLRAENVPGEIRVTGNTGIDAAIEAASRFSPAALDERAVPTILVACYSRESWQVGPESIVAALTELAIDCAAKIELVLHPDPLVAGRMRRLLSSGRGIKLLEPCGHDELLRLVRDADLVLSDSGEIEEEAPVLGVPLLVLREKTERPEGIAAGTTRLVGTSRERIVAEVRALLDDPAELAAMSRCVFPFGDGFAAGRIATIITEWLEQRSLTRRLA